MADEDSDQRRLRGSRGSLSEGQKAGSEKWKVGMTRDAREQEHQTLDLGLMPGFVQYFHLRQSAASAVESPCKKVYSFARIVNGLLRL